VKEERLTVSKDNLDAGADALLWFLHDVRRHEPLCLIRPPATNPSFPVIGL
jgi:hypothetical protein